MTTFSELKNNQQDSFKKLTEKLQALANPSFNSDDDTYWSPTIDKAGSAFAIVRLLPAPPGEEDAIIRLYTHAFQGPSGWYIENSLTTLGKDDPCGEMNTKLWAQGEESEGRRFVSGDPKNRKPGSKRKVRFISNVYVVKDTGNPENEGKVFRWRFGSKIYDKIVTASNPKYQDTVAFDPFNLWTGANLKIKIRKGDGGWPNYDDSKFDMVQENNVEVPRGALFDDDDKMEQIWRSAYSLQELIAPNKFKTYNELKARLIKIMDDKNIVPTSSEQQAPAPTGKTREVNTNPPWKPQTPEASESEDSELAFFKSLAAGDDEIPF